MDATAGAGKGDGQAPLPLKCLGRRFFAPDTPLHVAAFLQVVKIAKEYVAPIVDIRLTEWRTLFV